MDVKRRKSGKEEKEGAISKLPKDLLCHTLSFLSTKEAALTSVLSKIWRYLFTLIPSLDLDDSIFVPGERPEECERTSFIEFVNRVLVLQSNSPTKKFSIRCHKGVDNYLVGDWVVKALRRGVTDLTLILLFPSTLYGCTHPNIFFYAQNLIKLKVGCGDLGPFEDSFFRADVIFTNLRNLHVDSIDFGHLNDARFARLLSKCPVLEELIVNCIKWHFWRSGASVSSSTLKRLTIDCEHYYHLSDSTLKPLPHEDEEYSSSGEPRFLSAHFGTQNPSYVSFDTPNLLYLNYTDFVAFNYPLVKMDSLVEARLDVGPNKSQMHTRDSDEFQVRWDATNLIMGIHNVQTLHLTSDTLEVISDFCKSVPVFHNLNHLSIESDYERRWNALPLLLINSPNLQTLVFHGLQHLVTDGCGDACDCITPSSSSSSSSSSSCLLSCPVKILKISNFGATCGEMSLVEHFLKKLPQLEQVTIVLNFDCSLEEDLHLSQVSEALEMAPRASPNCSLKVVN